MNIDKQLADNQNEHKLKPLFYQRGNIINN